MALVEFADVASDWTRGEFYSVPMLLVTYSYNDRKGKRT